MSSEEFQAALRYHARTKHHFHAYARGPGYLDWESQPDPFRRYIGAPVLELDLVPVADEPPYELAFLPGQVAIANLNLRAISQLFFDSLALSAWKEAAGNRWALRVNPSSGNLHPTEAYLICGAVPGLTECPILAHYAPRQHALEVRAQLSDAGWRAFSDGFPEGVVFLVLTSIHWREAWKYGERAFRYCQHDVGHAIGALTVASAGLGWGTRLIDDVATLELEQLVGLELAAEAEAEHADCILAIFPQDPHSGTWSARPTAPVLSGLSGRIESLIAGVQWLGTPNALSSDHVDWNLELIASAVRKPATRQLEATYVNQLPPLKVERTPISLREIVRRRRSAVAMDARSAITRIAFWQILSKTMPGPDQIPFTTLPWRPMVDLVFFVHRVEGLTPGLYLLARDPRRVEPLRAGFRDDFEWEKPEGCPPELSFFRLLTGDARRLAAQVSCGQDIAADGCFSLAMLAEFEAPLREYGGWQYPRLFWECGLLGQVLYLEAEASGVRATGIGCYFDDPVHELLGIQDRSFQDLYHFTVGGAVDDARLSTLPAYGIRPA